MARSTVGRLAIYAMTTKMIPSTISSKLRPTFRELLPWPIQVNILAKSLQEDRLTDSQTIVRILSGDSLQQRSILTMVLYRMQLLCVRHLTQITGLLKRQPSITWPYKTAVHKKSISEQQEELTVTILVREYTYLSVILIGTFKLPSCIILVKLKSLD